MKLRYLNEEPDGTQCVEIRCSDISFGSLLRFIKKMEGVKVLASSHDPMNDNAHIDLTYFGTRVSVDTPFSDYLINCSESKDNFSRFIDELCSHKVRFWHRPL